MSPNRQGYDDETWIDVGMLRRRGTNAPWRRKASSTAGLLRPMDCNRPKIPMQWPPRVHLSSYRQDQVRGWRSCRLHPVALTGKRKEAAVAAAPDELVESGALTSSVDRIAQRVKASEKAEWKKLKLQVIRTLFVRGLKLHGSTFPGTKINTRNTEQD